jgi:hypothetical protein
MPDDRTPIFSRKHESPGCHCCTDRPLRDDLERATARIRARVGLIRANESAAPSVAPSVSVVAHLLPLGREHLVTDDLSRLRFGLLHHEWRSASAGDLTERFNREGYLIETSTPRWYVQCFRDGGVEFGTNELLQAGPPPGLDGVGLRTVLAQIFPAMFGAVLMRNIPGPFLATVTIVGLSGQPLLGMPDGWLRTINAEGLSNRFDDDVCVVPPLILDAAPSDLASSLSAVAPLAERLWQCAGFPTAPRLA